MNKHDEVKLIQRLVKQHQGQESELPKRFTKISTDRYTDPEELELEEQALFKELPIIVAHTSEVSEPGSFVCEQVGGVPLLIIRDLNGDLGVFVNACRHRGARLVDSDKGFCKKLMVCPYHAWSYKLNGELAGVPEKASFGNVDFSQLNLAAVQFSEEFAYIWVTLEGDPSEVLDIRGALGDEISHDFDHFGFSTHRVHKQVTTSNDCNWKLVMDAFAEGYHVNSLHKESLSRFFLKANIHDDYFPHVRQTGGRKTLLSETSKSPENWNFRLNTTLFYNIFPNSIFVFHPHWVSQMSLFPDGPEKMKVVHRMMIAEPPADAEVAAKLDASFDLIQSQVFEKEDLAVSASIQTTISSGVNKEFTIGGMEEGVRIFHEARDHYIASFKNRGSCK